MEEKTQQRTEFW